MNAVERCEHDKTHNCSSCGYIVIDGEKVFYKNLVLKGAVSECHKKFVHFMAEKFNTLNFFFHNGEIHVPEGQGKSVGLVICGQLRAWEHLYRDIDTLKDGLVTYIEEIQSENIGVLSDAALKDVHQIIEDGGIGKRPLISIPRLNYKCADATELFRRIGYDEVEKHFKAAPFGATTLWTDNEDFSYFKINPKGSYIFNNPNREWWGCPFDGDGEIYDLYEIKRYIAAFRLIRRIGTLEAAQDAVNNCPDQHAYIESYGNCVSYYVVSNPEDGVLDWAYLWNGKQWEPSDDGYVTNKQLVTHTSRFIPLADVVEAVQRVSACQ
nr:hypothetical protein [uncultured Acinetobacter sp.]